MARFSMDDTERDRLARLAHSLRGECLAKRAELPAATTTGFLADIQLTMHIRSSGVCEMCGNTTTVYGLGSRG